MGYLKLRYNSKLTFDPSYPEIDYSNFWECDWKDFYKGAVEAIPLNAILLRRHSRILGEKLFFDNSSPMTPTFCGKGIGYWL